MKSDSSFFFLSFFLIFLAIFFMGNTFLTFLSNTEYINELEKSNNIYIIFLTNY